METLCILHFIFNYFKPYILKQVNTCESFPIMSVRYLIGYMLNNF